VRRHDNFPLEPSRSNSLEIRRINPIEYANWNGLIASQPKHSFFHTAEWAKVLTETYGYTPVYFTADEKGGVRSLLPLMEVDSWLTGQRGIGLPFTDDCEPLCADASTFQKLFKSAVEFGKSRNWKYIECRGGRELFGEVPASLLFYGHGLDLTAGEDELFSRLESSVRRAIRKAEKKGVTVEILQNVEAVQIFYSLQRKTRKKHGLPPQPFKFFLNIHKHILSQDMGMVVVATHHGRPIAASVYVNFGDRAIYKYGASDEAFQDLRGSNLVMWAAIKECVRRGARHLDLGRTSVGNEGLRKFKLGWGAEEYKIEYVKFNMQKNGFVAGAGESSGWHTWIFRRMPVFLSRVVGAVLYKHWA
jgi:Acetyltransferase (GNAT) domain